MLNIFVNVGISSCCQSEVILPSARLWIWSMSKSLVLCDGHHSCEEIWRWPLKSGAYQWQRPVYSLSTYPWFHMIHLLWVYSTNATIYWEERSSRLRWFEEVVNNHGAQGFLLQSTIDLCLASPIVSYSYGCVSSGYLKEGVDDWYDVLQRVCWKGHSNQSHHQFMFKTKGVRLWGTWVVLPTKMIDHYSPRMQVGCWLLVLG